MQVAQSDSGVRGWHDSTLTHGRAAEEGKLRKKAKRQADRIARRQESRQDRQARQGGEECRVGGWNADRWIGRQAEREKQGSRQTGRDREVGRQRVGM